MKYRAICISVSDRNKKYLDILEKYMEEFNSGKAQTIFRIISEYDKLKSGEL
jgi:hypothetical protein